MNTREEIEELQRRLDRLKQLDRNFGINHPISERRGNLRGDKITEKMRKWLFIILTSLVAGIAVILIIWRIISRFF